MPHRANPKHFLILSRVTTLAEAARLTYSAPGIIRYAIDAGNIAADKVGGVWLVSVESLNEWNDRRLRKTS